MCFFLKVPFFPDDRKYMCFLGFPTVGKIFSLCAFYFPIIRLSFPIDRKENESQDVITEKQKRSGKQIFNIRKKNAIESG